MYLFTTYKGIPEHKHYDIRFLFRVPNNSEYIVSDESNDLKWITKHDVCPDSSYGFRRMFTKWQSM